MSRPRKPADPAAYQWDAGTPQLGKKIRIFPAAFGCEVARDDYALQCLAREATAQVVQIHWAHRYYRVAFEAGDTVLYECFKF